MNLRVWAVKPAYPQFFIILFGRTAHSLAFDGLHQYMQVIVETRVLAAQIDNGSTCMHYRGVVTTTKRPRLFPADCGR
jgi:hypothetical protein